MLLKGQVPKDQLEFDPEIEKTPRKKSEQEEKRKEEARKSKRRIFQHSQLTQSNRVTNG